jgi:hypothetical protein
MRLQSGTYYWVGVQGAFQILHCSVLTDVTPN